MATTLNAARNLVLAATYENDLDLGDPIAPLRLDLGDTLANGTGAVGNG